MKRRVQRGRAHCVASGEGRSPTLREPYGPAPESGWAFTYPDAGYQTWRSRHRHCPDTRARRLSNTLSRMPAQLFKLPVSQSAGEPEIRNRIPEPAEPAPSRRPAFPEPRQNEHPKASVQSAPQGLGPCETWTLSTSPKRNQVRQRGHPVARRRNDPDRKSEA
jgi:hypothetical protein